MDLVIDVGNSNIVCGFFNEKKGDYRLIKSFRMSTPTIMTTDELSVNFKGMLTFNGLENIKIGRVMLSSVVPSINHNFSKMLDLYFGVELVEITYKFFKDFIIDYDKPTDMGMDRLVNLKAASVLYGTPCVVVDYGTAITIDACGEDHSFKGGMIIPGVSISLNALVSNTSKLPKIELNHPKRLLGKSTKECMQNGLYYLNGLGVDAIIKEILEDTFKDQKDKVMVIATGGLSGYLAKYSHIIKNIDNNLALIGVKILLDHY